MKTSTSITLPYAPSLALLLVAALGPSSAFANPQETSKLENLINRYRASSPACEGRPALHADALTSLPSLAQLNLSRGNQLDHALRQAGIRMARAEAIMVSGPQNADAAMNAIKNKYCEALVRPEYTLIGVSHEAGTWRIILARPLLSETMGTSAQAGRKVLDLVNAVRSKPRVCGDKRYPAARPLAWNDTLAKAALMHSSDMAKQNYFQHQDKEGVTAAERSRRAGYRWQRIGENIAAGQGSPQEAMKGWLASPGHCANIMDPDFSEMGAAFAISQTSDAGIYWTQVFGKPR
ncbi:CAP domain-containing protein [Herbaspirillum sp. GCM10030257]|uniref:CAP domain-containing protein n=1 Tax=Herbaspirillum sp. GCM10030257 TaxID=3273393 RepID=UPI00361E1C72